MERSGNMWQSMQIGKVSVPLWGLREAYSLDIWILWWHRSPAKEVVCSLSTPYFPRQYGQRQYYRTSECCTHRKVLISEFSPWRQYIIRLYLKYVGIDIIHAININIYFRNKLSSLFYFLCTFYDMGWFSLKVSFLINNVYWYFITVWSLFYWFYDN